MNNFFGSKLNTVLLLVLIVLMSMALKVMYKNQATYVDPLLGNKTEEKNTAQEMDRSKILGNKDDLVSFSIWPGAKLRGVLSYRGVMQGGYFFEGNILINILDQNKKLLKSSNAMAKGEWMTVGPVNFEGNIDFTGLPKGLAYFEIHNDNASGIPEKDKSVLIPIVIE